MPTMLREPESPATTRQLFKLYQLLKLDTRHWGITKQQASDMIEGLELSRTENNRPLVIPEGDMPFEEAKVWLIEGEQRSGKTCTGVAKVVDSYFSDCVRIYCKDVLKIKCEVKSYNVDSRVARIKYNGAIKQIIIPNNYKLHSSMRIFSNIHLFGIPYIFIPTFRHALKWLKSGFLSHGWLILDEAHVGINARSSMGKVGQEMEKQSFQYGKAMLNVIIITHMARMIDWTARTIPTVRISCTFDRKTWKITYTIRKKNEPGTREITYYAPYYYRFYWTNERINA